MDCHVLLQGIFLTQESNPGLLHCRQILYRLSYAHTQVLVVNHENQVSDVKLGPGLRQNPGGQDMWPLPLSLKHPSSFLSFLPFLLLFACFCALQPPVSLAIQHPLTHTSTAFWLLPGPVTSGGGEGSVLCKWPFGVEWQQILQDRTVARELMVWYVQNNPAGDMESAV